MNRRILANLYRFAGVITLALASATLIKTKNANW